MDFANCFLRSDVDGDSSAIHAIFLGSDLDLSGSNAGDKTVFVDGSDCLVAREISKLSRL